MNLVGKILPVSRRQGQGKKLKKEMAKDYHLQKNEQKVQILWEKRGGKGPVPAEFKAQAFKRWRETGEMYETIKSHAKGWKVTLKDSLKLWKEPSIEEPKQTNWTEESFHRRKPPGPPRDSSSEDEDYCQPYGKNPPGPPRDSSSEDENRDDLEYFGKFDVEDYDLFDDYL